MDMEFTCDIETLSLFNLFFFHGDFFLFFVQGGLLNQYHIQVKWTCE